MEEEDVVADVVVVVSDFSLVEESLLAADSGGVSAEVVLTT